MITKLKHLLTLTKLTDNKYYNLIQVKRKINVFLMKKIQSEEKEPKWSLRVQKQYRFSDLICPNFIVFMLSWFYSTNTIDLNSWDIILARQKTSFCFDT